MSLNPSHIKSLLLRVLELRSTHRELTEFVNLCHKMAVTYLHSKKTYGKFNPENIGLTLEDFAYDSIAELFKQSDKEFPELIQYFDKFKPIEQSSSEEILNALRCLIFSSVNHRIYRTYREHDPSLGKIIRNVKEHLAKHPTATLVEVAEEKYIKPCNVNVKKSSSLITPELFSIEFFARLPENASLDAMLTLVAEILSEQTEHQQMIPITETALLIRSAYSRNNIEPSSYEQSFFTSDELKMFISESVQQTKRYLHSSYVQKGKLTCEESATYCNVISDILQHEFLHFEQDGQSYFSIMKNHFPTLMQEQYNEHHRVILEYVAKQAKNDLRERLKREL